MAYCWEIQSRRACCWSFGSSRVLHWPTFVVDCWLSQGGDTVRQLLKLAKKTVPRSEWKRTPVVLKATAGLRLLPVEKAKALLEEVGNLKTTRRSAQTAGRETDCPAMGRHTYRKLPASVFKESALSVTFCEQKQLLQGCLKHQELFY